MGKVQIQQHSLYRFILREFLGHTLRVTAVLVLVFGGLSAGAQSKTKNVLILYSFSERTVTTPQGLLESSLRTRFPWPVNFYVEYLESREFPNPGYEKAVVENLQNRYGT